MKYLIFSDIHGAVDSVEYLIDIYNKGKFDLMICLGDVLYHGPRNDLPKNYNPKKVIEILNNYKDKILCIKGNCEAEVDQMVLNFKILDFYDGILNDLNVHLEHGHHLDEYKGNADLVLYGHTHIPACEKNKYMMINPGSITIPKGLSKRGYVIWDNHDILGYTIDGEIVFKYSY